MIKSTIQKVLIHFPRINCLQRVLRHLHNKDYCNAVLNAAHAPIYLHWSDPRCLYVEHLGKMNPDKFIYIFKETEAIGGFFAQHRRMLLGLAYADAYGLTPVVYYGDDYRYHEEDPIDGTTNGYEYYFCQPSGVSYEEALASQNVIKFTPIHLTMLNKGYFDYYSVSDREIEYLAKIQRKYIKMKPSVEKEIMDDIHNLLGEKRTLAVHIRGTDFRLGLAKHPIPLNTKDQIIKVERVMKEEGFDQVFVATDEQETIDAFQAHFGNNAVFYNDVFRSKTDTAAQYSYSNRPLHKYKLGIEVLRDMTTLASCQGLIGGLSQVCFGARITKKSWNEQYDYLEIADLGKFKENSKHAEEVIEGYKKDGRIPTTFQ